MNGYIKLVCVSVALLFLTCIFAGCTDTPGVVIVPVPGSKDQTFSGYCGDPTYGTEPPTKTFELGGNASYVTKVTATLTWVDDEAAQGSDPDEFKLDVKGDGASKSGDNSKGSITVTIQINSTADAPTKDGIPPSLGKVSVTVNCINCGFTPDRKNWGLIHLGHHDAGNPWDLDVKYDYFTLGTNATK